MELQELTPFVLMIVLTGMILGVGILTLDNLGDAVKKSTDIVNESVTFIGAGLGSTANDEVTEITYVGNGTIDCTVFNTALWCANYTDAGAITLNASTFTDVTANYNVSYTYDADVSTTTVTTDVNSALGAISTTWLALIVTVFVLAIILVLVIRSFKQGR